MWLTKEEKKLDIDEVIKKMEEGLITPKKAEEVLLNATRKAERVAKRFDAATGGDEKSLLNPKNHIKPEEEKWSIVLQIYLGNMQEWEKYS